jgi:hypothetical protein
VPLQIEKKVEQQALETFPLGGAGSIVAYPRSSAGQLDPAVTRSLKKVVGESGGKRLAALRQTLAEAQDQLKQPAH